MTAYAVPMADATHVTGRRIGAWFIDLVIYLVLVGGLLLALGGFEVETRTFPNGQSAAFFCDSWQQENDGYCQNTNGDVLTVESNTGLAYALFFGHLVAYIVIQGLAGGSLGKLAVGLRVVDDRGRQAGIWRSAARTLMWVVDAITFAVPIVGGILILSTRGHRRLGDMVAGTYVVPKEQMGRAPLSHTAAPPPPVGAGAWGSQPSAGGGWPGASSAPTTSWSPPSTSPAGAPAGDGPTWDSARNAYIQYDRQQGTWMQWSDSRQSWGPIDR